MPPNVPRKRLRDKSPVRAEPSSKRPKGKTAALVQPWKPTLFDDLDADATGSSSPLRKGASAIHKLHESDDDDSSSSLSSLSDADFEDVHIAKKRKVAAKPADEDEDEDEDEDIEFEDVQPALHTSLPEGPEPSGDLELTLHKDARISLTNPLGQKKGPSKRERLARSVTHCVHVQSLLWHNAVRNSWLCDPEVQGIMISLLPPRLWEEVERWRRNSGLESAEEVERRRHVPGKSKAKDKGKGKGKDKDRGKTSTAGRSSRDWGEAASRLEVGAVDMSHGDPLFRLLKSLAAWWKQRFRVTAPGIRKMGYMSLERLDRLTKAFKAGTDNPRLFGERVANIEQFKELAQQCTGSRDVGAQLFTALLRGLGLEARLVASLQPVGFGWNKLEDADPEPDERLNSEKSLGAGSSKTAGELPEKAPEATAKRRPSKQPPRRGSRRNAKPDPEDSDDFELVEVNSDNDSVVGVPEIPAKKTAAAYDKDLEFPHYWTEVLSPVTHKYVAVDAVVKSIVATNRELVESFEPRGAKADRAKQVVAYIVGFSQDGTAKDVTIRYLKRQMLPGRTKGLRMAIEKVPIYDKNGKVRRYEQFDWFKSVMLSYVRGGKKHPITEIDEEEDSTDLKPAKLEKKEIKEGEETLQYYKQSAEFVLERHLKREEALVPDAQPVKVFKTKARGGEFTEENVYLRKDVVGVKSAETWHKQGRAPMAGEEPLKRVPYRAATTNRRREIAEAEAATGEKVLQGLYSFDQTDWIIPPPIQNGVIPKNEYGNIDLFVEHMCPAGAVHVPYRGAVKVCKRLQVDYAEAVVDFEFGHRMAVPVIQGVVIAEEHYDKVMEELAKDEAERARKEDEKRRTAAISMWRKMLMGMRIMERIQRDYGDMEDDKVVSSHPRREQAEAEADEDMAGGFLPEGYEEEQADEGEPDYRRSSFFPVADDEDGEEGEGSGHLLIEDHRTRPPLTSTPAAYPTPQSGTSSERRSKGRKGRKGKGKEPEEPAKPASPARLARRGARRAAPVSDDEADEEDSEIGDGASDSASEYEE